MKTTEQWWQEVSGDPDKMINWLKDQYHGEVTAEKRIRDLTTQYDLTPDQEKIINKIADDEKIHALWVKELLEVRGIAAEVLDKEERYWNKTLPKEDVSFEEMCAIGHHAELMRLDRITLLANDERFEDIASVFAKIRPDEVFHTKAFASMSTHAMIEKTRKNHEDGLNALGLVA